MSLTESEMLPLATKAPSFQLVDTTDNKEKLLENLKGEKGTLIMFICNHCPYVIHVIEELVNIANIYQSKGLSSIAISSNDVEKYPEDRPEKMRAFSEKYQFAFPYLYDESQQVAKAYHAACTPDLFLFDKDLKCFYRGRLDASSPGNGHPVNGFDLRGAIDALLQGEKTTAPQIPSMGCNIKWK